MKTTIQINDALIHRAKQLATERRTTLRSVIESALRQFLDPRESGSQGSFRLRRHSFRGRGMQAGLTERDWAAIRERAYEGRGVDRGRHEHPRLRPPGGFAIASGSRGRPWAIPWPCIHEFLAIVTHPRIYNPPTPLADAMEQVECWLEAPHLAMLGEEAGYWKALRGTLNASRVVGPRVHDARVATLCLQHGVRVLWSADRDLARFSIRVVNPLTPAANA